MPRATPRGDPCTWWKPMAQRSCLQNDDFMIILAHPRLASSTRSPAVTRLAVHRRLQVPAQDARTRRRPGTYVWQVDLCVVISLDPSICFQRSLIISSGIDISCRMQRVVAIHALGGKLWPNIAVCRTTISSESHRILAARGRILAHPSST